MLNILEHNSEGRLKVSRGMLRVRSRVWKNPYKTKTYERFRDNLPRGRARGLEGGLIPESEKAEGSIGVFYCKLLFYIPFSLPSYIPPVYPYCTLSIPLEVSYAL